MQDRLQDKKERINKNDMNKFDRLYNSILKEEYGPRPVYREPGSQPSEYGILLHKEDRYGNKGPFFTGDQIDGGPFEGDIKLLSVDLLDTKEGNEKVFEVTYAIVDEDGNELEGVSERVTQTPPRVLGMANIKDEFGNTPGYFIVNGDGEVI